MPVSREAARLAVEDPAIREQIFQATGTFRDFLNVWRFESTEENTSLVLGEHLWHAQEMFVEAVACTPNLFALKARRLGQSTIAAANCGYLLRRAPANVRVHIFSRGEREAVDLLRSVAFGLENLPPYLRLPVVRRAAHVFEFEGSRICRAYAAAGTSGIDQGCEFALFDEWARHPDPADLYQRVEPTAKTSLILTVGVGPQGAAADYWRACEAGLGKHTTCFIPADARPGRDKVQMEIKRRELNEIAYRREYAMTAEDALSGGGALVFHPEEIEAATVDAAPLLADGKPGRKYVSGWDLGSRADATVGITLDVSDSPYLDVVGFTYLRGADYNEILKAIRETHHRFAAGQHFTVLEENGIGAVVLDSTTSRVSRASSRQAEQGPDHRGRADAPPEAALEHPRGVCGTAL